MMKFGKIYSRRQRRTYEIPISRPSNPYRFLTAGWGIYRGAVATSGRRLTGAKMAAECSSHDWRYRKIREWQLLLLRFAVTREASDQSAALAVADELDSFGMRWRPAAPSFFLRTSNEVCEAILAEGNGHDNTVLLRHVARIEDPRLRRAFRAAVGLQQTSEPQPQSAKEKRPKHQGLWKGLAEK